MQADKNLFVLELTQQQLSVLKCVFENSKELSRITRIIEKNPSWNLFLMEIIRVVSLIINQNSLLEKLYQDIFLQVACQQPFSTDLELSI
jgi:hypothetical protein